MSKQKAQGTRHESGTVKLLTTHGYTARRIAEGGSADEGDVLTTMHGTEWVWECKARQVLNIQAVLGRARAKAGGRPVAVLWRRLVPVAGKARRQPVAGERDVLVMSPADWFAALAAARQAGYTDGLAAGMQAASGPAVGGQNV